MRPYGPKFSQFHAGFRKIWQNHMLAPPWRVGAPQMGNPGSAPVFGKPWSTVIVTYQSVYYRPHTKYGEGNVFTGGWYSAGWYASYWNASLFT